MEDTKGLGKVLLLLLIIDIAVYLLGLLINQFSDMFGFLLLMLMCITGIVLSEYLRRRSVGEKTSDNYPEW